MKNQPKNFQREAAMEAIMDAEMAYQFGWAEDAMTHLQNTLYHRIADLVDPKDEERIVDIGTGTGYQLLFLAKKNPKGIYIGTERTPANVLAAQHVLEAEGLDRYFAFLAASSLEVTGGREVYWQQNLESLKGHMAEIRRVIDEKLVIISDNILYPEAIPYLLEGKRLDGGIMSLPGGSSMRSLEWPYGLHDEIDDDQAEQRAYDITNTTRTAFYHFMSEYVRPQGRIVVADRGVLHSDIPIAEAAMSLVERRMEGLTKYWKPIGGGFMPLDMDNTTVTLKATNAAGQRMKPSEAQAQGNRVGIFFGRLDRNDVPFDEKSLPRP